ncbi:MAG: TFIIB-type zinc ribbon-containing protein, partial [Planctomycetota bacterium]
ELSEARSQLTRTENKLAKAKAAPKVDPGLEAQVRNLNAALEEKIKELKQARRALIEHDQTLSEARSALKACQSELAAVTRANEELTRHANEPSAGSVNEERLEEALEQLRQSKATEEHAVLDAKRARDQVEKIKEQGMEMLRERDEFRKAARRAESESADSRRATEQRDARIAELEEELKATEEQVEHLKTHQLEEEFKKASQVRCPKCKGVMEEQDDLHGITLDVCSVCNGVYFDDGEINQLIDAVARQEGEARAGGFMRRLFRRQK